MDERINMMKVEKAKRLNEINQLVLDFCEEHLNEELADYVLKLCETLGRKRKISINRGSKEIWAAAIVYVIARLNFLFDSESEFCLTADTICDYFGTKKSTIGSKATYIENVCNIGLGAEGFCSPEISDSLTLVELPNGLVMPKSMVPRLGFVVEAASNEETKELEEFMAEQQQFKERKIAEKKARRAEINRKIAEDKKKKKKENDKQLALFDSHEDD
ncbi:MAG: DUF6398 domain-containing protein [Desulfatiglandales bacterium]|jgi:hypothetical protein